MMLVKYDGTRITSQGHGHLSVRMIDFENLLGQKSASWICPIMRRFSQNLQSTIICRFCVLVQRRAQHLLCQPAANQAN